MSFVIMSILNSFIFFSSRRRHTRLQGDWSSDVCSSDLQDKAVQHGGGALTAPGCSTSARSACGARRAWDWRRTGERRGGEEGRSRGAAVYLKKKKSAGMHS